MKLSIKTILIKSLCVSALISISVASNAQKFPKRVYDKGTLGYSLQSQLQKQCQYCKIIKKIDSTRDYVPADVIQFSSFDLSKTLVENITASSNALQTYIFNNDEISQSLDQEIFTPNPDRTIQILNFLPSFSLLNSSKFSAFAYSKNCVSLLRAHQNAGIKFTVANIDESIDADQKKTSALYAFQGWFSSPLKSILDNQSANKTSLLMYLWDFYCANPNYNNNAYYLNQFPGITIGRTANVDEYQRLDATLSLNYSGPIASAQGTVSDSSASSSNFQGSSYQTLIVNQFKAGFPRKNMFALFPNTTKISNYFLRLTPQPFTIPDNVPMAENVEHTHYVDIEGINSNNWVLSNISKENLDLDSLYITNISPALDKPGFMRFELKCTPNSKFFVDPKNPVDGITISYNLEYTNKFNNEKIIIPVKKIFRTTSQPNPVASQSPVMFATETNASGRYCLTWTQPITFDDKSNPVDYSLIPQVTGNDAKILVGNKSIPVNAVLIFSTGTCTLKISSIIDYSYDNDFDLSAKSMVPFSGTFTIPIKSVKTHLPTKPIDLTLIYPLPKPTQSTLTSTSVASPSTNNPSAGQLVGNPNPPSNGVTTPQSANPTQNTGGGSTPPTSNPPKNN